MHFQTFYIILLLYFNLVKCSASGESQLCMKGYDGQTSSLDCQITASEDGGYIKHQLIIANSESVEINCPRELFTANATIQEYVWKSMRSFKSEGNTVITVRIRNCPFSETNVTSLLQDIGIDLPTVQIIDYDYFSYDNDTKLPTLAFKGFENALQITARRALSTVSDDLFHNLKNIQILNLHDNFIRNITGVFGQLKLLKQLQLGSNKLDNIDSSAFKGLDSLVRLNLDNNYISSLPEDVFEPLREVSALGLSLNHLSSLPPKIFAHNTKLRQLSLARNLLKSIPSTLFANLTSLTFLDLRENLELSQLPEDLFLNNENLTELRLSYCNISSIPPKLFEKLAKVKNLDLSSNVIEFLGESNFRGLSSLEELKLGYNRIRNIGDNVFSGLPFLAKLELHSNKLQSLSSEAFGLKCKLKNLNLSRNLLTFESSFPIFEVYDDGTLNQSPLRHCMELTAIDLSHNNISTIFSDWIYNMGYLTSLNLAYNNFSYLEYVSLSSFILPDDITVTVDLRHNNIRNVDMSAARYVDPMNSARPKPNKLLVAGNPLNCDCNAYSLAQYLHRSLPGAKANWEVEGAVCSSPPNLEQTPVDQVGALDFLCSYSDDDVCPAECHCTQRPADNKYLLSCRDNPRKLLAPANYNLHLNLSSSRVKLGTLLQSSIPLNNVAVLDLSNTSVSTSDLDLDWSAFNRTFPQLRKLLLNSNRLESVPESALEAWKASGVEVTLGDNPWICDCELQNLLQFVILYPHQVLDLALVVCDGRRLIQWTVDELCAYLQAGILAVIVVVLVVLVVVLLAGIIAWRWRRTIRAWMYASGCCLQWVVQMDDDDDDDKPYDAFVSFSHKDEDFVLKTLVPALEEPTDGSPAYRLCLHYRDWLAGEWIPEQIARSVACSKRTIVVLSPHFLESVWGQLEFRTAYNQVLKDKRNRLIVIVNGALPAKDLMDQDLKTYLSLNTYLQWGDPWFWQRLRYALPHKKFKEASNLTKAVLGNHHNGITDHSEAIKLNKGLSPLPLSRSNVKIEIVVPPEIELNLTPTNSVGSGDPIFPQGAK